MLAEDSAGSRALLTRLTARRAHADAVVRIIRDRIGDAPVASAEDPGPESWLGLMGCRRDSDTPTSHQATSGI